MFYFINAGSNVEMPGINTIAMVPAIIEAISTGICGMILWMGCPPTEDATNRLIPTGGVTSPIHKVTTITTPK